MNKLQNKTEQQLTLSNDLTPFTIPKVESPLSSKELYLNSIVQALLKVINEDMQSTTPLFKKIKDGFIYSLAQKIVNNPTRSLILGVTGESASGKTTLVNNAMKACLKDRVSNVCTIVRCDDYFKDTSKELIEAGSFEGLFKMGVNFDIPDAYNLDIMKSHMKELFKGNPITSPRYDFITCESLPEGEQKLPAKIILSEGLFALNNTFKNILDASIYIHTPEEIIEKRWFDRAVQRGKTPEDAKVMFNIVKTEARNHIIPQMNEADIIINGLASAEYIEAVADRILDTIRESTKQFV